MAIPGRWRVLAENVQPIYTERSGNMFRDLWRGWGALLACLNGDTIDHASPRGWSVVTTGSINRAWPIASSLSAKRGYKNVHASTTVRTCSIDRNACLADHVYFIPIPSSSGAI